ncbi:YceI family protein, partial [Cobetia marina]
LEGQLTLHDSTQTLPVSLQVTRLQGERWLVQTDAPVMVDASQFSLVNGIRTLRDLAGLGNIATQVPVSVKAIMTQEE